MQEVRAQRRKETVCAHKASACSLFLLALSPLLGDVKRRKEGNTTVKRGTIRHQSLLIFILKHNKINSLAISLDLNAIAAGLFFLKFRIVCERMMSYGSLCSSSVFCCSHQGAQAKNRRREKKAKLLAPSIARILI